MPKVFTSKSQRKGELGETIACNYLISKGFHIIERNYTQKWGEIDIIAMKDSKLYFYEVKAVTREIRPKSSVSYETTKTTSHHMRPEENMHRKKIEKIYRTIQTYLLHRHVSHETEWQLDLICVYMDDKQRKAQIEIFENII